MSESPVERKNYSTLRILEDRLEEKAQKDLTRLSIADLKGVIVWLELQQHRIAYENALEDDPVKNAKGRGKVEMIVGLCSELTSMIQVKSKEDADG